MVIQLLCETDFFLNLKKKAKVNPYQSRGAFSGQTKLRKAEIKILVQNKQSNRIKFFSC